ncbi:hypothetical protein LYSBPC_07790 [Lysinibacillus piscis]|uniref:VWA domain-containing protein n=2 Tax=Lysinibacillus piscis TaxID=2518931 RepID=A0ABQ5NHT3_9BACI|nr:hypothetical protein LYSBPC_07790 [Lysinibacillus sp. KH24]
MGFSQMMFSWAAIIPMIVLLYYFFRKKYTEQTVASTLFWAELMQETRVSPYLKHLQKNALLFLQLLALFLLVLALMNPYIKKSTIVGSQVIFIVDTSATMLAGKGQSTFEAHRQDMLALLPELQGRPVTIITTGHTPQSILQQETNSKVIEQAIQALQVTYETAEINKALDVAQAFIGEALTSVYIWTDALDKKQLPIEKESVKWIVQGAATDLINMAITRFAATTDGQMVMALVQLHNDTEKEQTVNLLLHNEQKEQIAQETLTIPPKETVIKTLKNLPLTNRLTATIDSQDDYTLDNEQTILLQAATSTIVVDQGLHQLIQKGVQTVDSTVKLMPASQLNELSNTTVITNQTALLQQMDKPVVLFGRDDVEKVAVNGHVTTINDALFAFSHLKDIYVGAIYPAYPNATTIASVGDQPFIQRSPQGDIIVLADIEDTDWPLHPSFPLFLWSVHQQLSTEMDSLGVFSPNEQRVVSLAQGEWNIYSQEDEFLSAITNGLLLAPMKPDIYMARSTGEEKPFIVQLQPQERMIEQGTSYTLGKLQVHDTEQATQMSMMPWFIVLIVLILVIEWEVQRRRGFTN